jgi:hypothetical protein
MADHVAVGLSERLRSLDNQAFGEELPHEAALASLATRRPRYSTRLGVLACVAALVFVVGVSGAFNADRGLLAAMASVALGFSGLAYRMRRVERDALQAIDLDVAHPLPSPPRLGWLPPSILAAAFAGIGVPTVIRRNTASGVLDLVVAALCVTSAAVRLVRWRRAECESRDRQTS